MSIELAIMLAGIAGTVILVLAIMAYRTVQRLRQVQQRIRERETKVRAKIVDDLRVLARCILADQMNLTEGCLRIKVLLDNLDPALQRKAGFEVFYSVYDEAKHFATHEARQSLPLRERLQEDERRERLEDYYRGSILTAARTLLDYRF